MIFALALAAAAYQDTATLDRAVAAFAGAPAGALGGPRAPVDPRLRLAVCPTLALSWRTAGKDAVVVSCPGPTWRIFVPVNAVPVTAITTATRAAPAARAEPVIRRGDPVTIEAGSDGFSITREGIAMADAAPGARLGVKVVGATQPVQAVALAGGRVTLPGWGE